MQSGALLNISIAESLFQFGISYLILYGGFVFVNELSMMSPDSERMKYKVLDLDLMQVE